MTTRRPQPRKQPIDLPAGVLPDPEGLTLPQVYKYRVALVRERAVPAPLGEILRLPHYVAEVLWRDFFHDLDREAMVAAYLDISHRLIGYSVGYVGTLSRVPAEPRGLLVPGLLINASGILLAHNHPSGDPTPSAEDLLFTRKLAQAAELLEMRLVDHVILGDETTWYSMKDRGGW